jgi:hypothetical protein
MLDRLGQWRILSGNDGSGLLYAATDDTRCRGKLLMMHRVLLDPPDGYESEHINRNGLDNRRVNLRLTTSSNNKGNMRKHRGASLYKGVHWDNRPESTGWRARIQVNYEKISLGHFDTEEEAARAYDVAARQFFGEYARLNFPGEGEQPAAAPHASALTLDMGLGPEPQ